MILRNDTTRRLEMDIIRQTVKCHKTKHLKKNFAITLGKVNFITIFFLVLVIKANVVSHKLVGTLKDGIAQMSIVENGTALLGSSVRNSSTTLLESPKIHSSPITSSKLSVFGKVSLSKVGGNLPTRSMQLSSSNAVISSNKLRSLHYLNTSPTNRPTRLSRHSGVSSNKGNYTDVKRIKFIESTGANHQASHNYVDTTKNHNTNPNGTSGHLRVFTDTDKPMYIQPTVPKVLSLRKRGMDETNSIKKHDSDSSSRRSGDEKNKPGMSDSLLPAEKSSTACPLECKCKWKRGKETVECASKGFKNIPYIKDSGTQVLDFPRNPIEVLEDDIFMRKNLLNLQAITLASCEIKSIQVHAFRQLLNLDKLDLTDNNLKDVPSSAMTAIPQLRELQLSQNSIRKIKSFAFSYLSELIKLELSSCAIEVVEGQAFSGLSNLRWLRLDQNRIKTLYSNTLLPLQSSLHGIDLYGNPWNCTCGMRPIRQWLLENNVPSSIPPPMCTTPSRLRNKSWDMIQLADFACPPIMVKAGAVLPQRSKHQIFPQHSSDSLSSILKNRYNEQNDIIGLADNSALRTRNVTLSCVVKAVPEAEIEWAWNGYEIRNGSLGRVGSTVFTVDEWSTPKYKISNLSILHADVEDHGGEYTCTGYNRAGHVTASIQLTMLRGRKPISTTRGVQHRPRDAAAEEAKISTGGIGELREQNSLYVVAAFAGGSFVFVSIFVVACFLSFRQKQRVQAPIQLNQNHSSNLSSPQIPNSMTDEYSRPNFMIGKEDSLITNEELITPSSFASSKSCNEICVQDVPDHLSISSDKIKVGANLSSAQNKEIVTDSIPKGFQRLTPKEHEKQFPTTNIQTIENIQNLKTDEEEYVPLIPKPPSYQSAMSEKNAVEEMKSKRRLEKDKDNDYGMQIQSTALVEINDNRSSSGKPTEESQINSSESSSNILESNSLSSQISPHTNALSLYDNRIENSSESDVKNLSTLMVLKDKKLENYSTSYASQQKVRFNLQPMRFDDENKDLKGQKLHDVNPSNHQEYAMHKSPSDPSVSFVNSLLENKGELSSNNNTPPDLPPRERKVRFQTGTAGPKYDSKSSSSYRTLPRNHRIQSTRNLMTDQLFKSDSMYPEPSELYSNVGQKRYAADEARWSLIPTDFSYYNNYDDSDDPRLVALEKRTHQLDTFLTEYKDLQMQLIEMRRECDSLRQENLKKDMEALKASLLNQPCKSSDKLSNQNTGSSPRNLIDREVVVKPILKNKDGISQLYKSHSRPSSEERLYYLANEHSSNEGGVQTDQRTVSRPRFQFKRRSSSFIPSRGYNSDVPYDDN